MARRGSVGRVHSPAGVYGRPRLSKRASCGMTDQPRCTHCREPIGLYEPVWVETANGVQSTSLLSLVADDVSLVGSERYWHDSCYAEDQRR